MKLCREDLMEDGWLANGEEGFTCSLPASHLGPHRAEGDGIGEDNTGTDIAGRKYTWVFEWRYE